jgi:hypothetical protein
MDHPACLLCRHGGIVVAPPDFAPFPVDSQQLAYLVERKYLELPDLSADDIRSMDKADGLARVVTMAQMAWYCLSCAARGASGLGFSRDAEACREKRRRW